MPRIRQRQEDAVVTKVEHLFTLEGAVTVLYFIEQVRDEAGTVIEQKPEQRVVIRDEEWDRPTDKVQSHGAAQRLAQKFLRSRYG